MSFAAPGWAVAFALLPLLLLASAAAERQRQRRRRAVLGPRFAGAAAPGTWRPAAVLALCVLAAMQPQWGAATGLAERRGSDLVIGIDVSRSMLARDQLPSRLEAARRDLAALVDSGPHDRLALLAFAGEARRLIPLTDDRQSFAGLIELAEPAAVRRGGTDLAAALHLAEELLPEDGERAPAIILLTDGEDHGAAARAALTAFARPVPVHTVGYGTAAGAKIRIESEGRARFVQDAAGEDVITRLEPDSLRALAIAAGGSYRDAAADPGLRELRRRLQGEARPVQGEADAGPARRARFVWPLLLAFLLLSWPGARRGR